MTREELEKEAIAKYKTGSYPQLHTDHYAFIHGYLVSAEPREKRNADLKQENRDLADCNARLLTQAAAATKRVVALEKENERLKRVCNDLTNTHRNIGEENKRLEKENAELKTDYKVLSCSVGDFGDLQDKLEEEQRKNNGLSDNLTKAKEIIRQFLNDYPVITKEVLDKLEQFIKEAAE